MKTVQQFISKFKAMLASEHIACHFDTAFCAAYRLKHKTCGSCESRLGCEALTSATKSFSTTETSVRTLGPVFGGDFSKQIEAIGDKTIESILNEASKLHKKGLEHDKASIGNL